MFWGGDQGKMTKKRVHLLISGRVQGVWFRASTRNKAQQLGLKGWVKNTSDGKVEAIFEGEEKNIEEIIKWCHKGPSLAHVTHIDIKQEQYKNEYKDFQIIY